MVSSRVGESFNANNADAGDIESWLDPRHGEPGGLDHTWSKSMNRLLFVILISGLLCVILILLVALLWRRRHGDTFDSPP